ncbi:MAG: hypothetical protein ABS58_02350 [Mesorhizobium sp. SCN 65-20]|nr:MAG: hypothetical protein ABS58_02350 [Mesorhizobium sp. SCN 65-20]
MVPQDDENHIRKPAKNYRDPNDTYYHKAAEDDPEAAEEGEHKVRTAEHPSSDEEPGGSEQPGYRMKRAHFWQC